MRVIHANGFDDLATGTADRDIGFPESWSASVMEGGPDGIGKHLYLDWGNNYWREVWNFPVTEGAFCAHIEPGTSSPHPNHVQFFSMVGLSFRLFVDNIQNLYVYDAAGAEIAGPVALPPGWKHFQIRFRTHPTAGYVLIRLNDSADIVSVTGVNTGTEGMTAVTFYGEGGIISEKWWIDNVVVVDADGSPAWPGPLRVNSFGVTGPGDLNEGVVTGAVSSAVAVADTPSDRDATSVTVGSGQRELFAHAAIPPEVGKILAARSVTVSRVQGRGFAAPRSVIRAGGVSVVTPLTSTGNGEFSRDRGGFFNTDPATGTPWSRARLNAAQIGIDVGPTTGPQPHRYWRMLTPSVYGFNPRTCCVNAEFRGVPGGPTLTTSGVPIASSVWGADVPANAFNGNPGVWAANGNVNEWIGWVFPEPTLVNEVTWTTWPSGDPWWGMPERVFVQSSDDGLFWRDEWMFAIAGGWEVNMTRVSARLSLTSPAYIIVIPFNRQVGPLDGALIQEIRATDAMGANLLTGGSPGGNSSYGWTPDRAIDGITNGTSFWYSDLPWPGQSWRQFEWNYGGSGSWPLPKTVGIYHAGVDPFHDERSVRNFGLYLQGEGPTGNTWTRMLLDVLWRSQLEVGWNDWTNVGEDRLTASRVGLEVVYDPTRPDNPEPTTRRARGFILG